MTREEVYKLVEIHYRKNFKKFVNITRGRAGSYHNAEDVVQEAFTRACKYHASYNPAITDFDAWFSRILENSLRTHTKDRRAQGMVHDSKNNHLITGTMADSFLRRFLSEINDDIALLSEGKQEVVNLNFFMGYTPMDISKIVNVNVGAIRTLLHRFREELRYKYGKGVYS